jgi:hypothetical protein
VGHILQIYGANLFRHCGHILQGGPQKG